MEQIVRLKVIELKILPKFVSGVKLWLREIYSYRISPGLDEPAQNCIHAVQKPFQGERSVLDEANRDL